MADLNQELNQLHMISNLDDYNKIQMTKPYNNKIIGSKLRINNHCSPSYWYNRDIWSTNKLINYDAKKDKLTKFSIWAMLPDNIIEMIYEYKYQEMASHFVKMSLHGYLKASVFFGNPATNILVAGTYNIRNGASILYNKKTGTYSNWDGSVDGSLICENFNMCDKYKCQGITKKLTRCKCTGNEIKTFNFNQKYNECVSVMGGAHVDDGWGNDKFSRTIRLCKTHVKTYSINGVVDGDKIMEAHGYAIKNGYVIKTN